MERSQIVTIQQTILDYKQKLKETDYKILKHIEGELDELEYEEIKAQRAEWREAINTLESQLRNDEIL